MTAADSRSSAARTPPAAGIALTRRRLLAAVSLILLLALVLPAMSATLVNRRRVTRAVSQASAIAGALLVGRLKVDGSAVLAGNGASPRSEVSTAWLDSRTGALSGTLPDAAPDLANPDPWGNRFLVNIGDLPVPVGDQPRAVWVLSAGPNGLIETAYGQSVAHAVVGGDDVAVRIR